MSISIPIFETLLSAPLGLYTEWELLDHTVILLNHMGFLGGSVVRTAHQCRSYRKFGFDPYVRNIPWRRQWQTIPVFWPGKFHRQGAWWVTVQRVAKELDITENTQARVPIKS